jgi:hypothetical protein
MKRTCNTPNSFSNPSQMPFSQHNYMIQAVTPDESDQPLHDRPAATVLLARKGLPLCSGFGLALESHTHRSYPCLAPGNLAPDPRETPPPSVALSTLPSGAPSR